ncbi:hypothetical protein PYCC9005_001417 [Savitreella phatthalungensis]
MARGNQRDKAREKAQKKANDATKGQRKDGLSYKKFQEQNAEVREPHARCVKKLMVG